MINYTNEEVNFSGCPSCAYTRTVENLEQIKEITVTIKKNFS